MEIGAAILAGGTSDVLRLAEEIVRTHHEWWDVGGYPRQFDPRVVEAFERARVRVAGLLVASRARVCGIVTAPAVRDPGA